MMDAMPTAGPARVNRVAASAVAEAVRAAFLDTVRGLEMNQVGPVAAALVERLGETGLLYVFGCGHSQLLALEGFHRAGSPAWVAPLLDERVSPLRGSGCTEAERRVGLGAELARRVLGAGARGRALLVVSASGESTASVEAAETARRLGILSIALTRDRSSPLGRAVDHVLEAGGTVGDAVLDVHGAPMAPQSTVAGVVLLHSLLATTEALRAAGSCLCSVHTEGGPARNAALMARYPHLSSP
jgi:uncharacterized phosphosugar-binding protein